MTDTASQKSTLQTLTIEKMIAGGDGLAHGDDGRVIFVAGALPDEEIIAEVRETKKDFHRARTLSVVRASPDRVEPPCPHFAQGCGGCDWQFADVEAQRQFKVDIIRDSLRRIAGLEGIDVQKIRGAEPVGYRTTVNAVADEEGRLQLHRRQSGETLPVESCLVADPLVRDVLSNARLPGAGEVRIRSCVAEHKTVVVTENECSSSWVPAHTTVVTRSDATNHARHSAQFEIVNGIKWRVSALSFFQSGVQAAEMLVETINNIVSEFHQADPIMILDAYAGIGLLGGSVMLARKNPADQLIAVENNDAAAGDASSNLNPLNAEVINVEMAKFRWRGKSAPDVLIADPGRPGLGENVSRYLSSLRAKTFLLVSCDPASMARDVKVIREMGYELKSVFPLDLFPHTSHIEAVSLLMPKK